MESYYGLNFDTFVSFVENMYDEIIVYDRNFTVVYINQASSRHYGCRPDQMIGKTFYDLTYAGWWKPSILPTVVKEKRSCAIRQKTFLGTELLTIAVPIFDDRGEVQYIVMNVRDSINDDDIYNSSVGTAMLTEALSTVTVVGESQEMKKIVRTLSRIAPLNTPCIFYGEHGVGKTRLAQYLHSISIRKDQVFGTFDCAGLPSDRVVYELFGGNDSLGLLDKMRTGTLLLKNISELDQEAQRLLLQNFSNVQIGVYNQVRVLASSRVDLHGLVQEGKFCEELYYKLGAVEIHVPPLRERQEDIRPLIEYFTGVYSAQFNVVPRFTEGAIQALCQVDWKRNVAQLRHTVQKLILTVEGGEIDVKKLPMTLFDGASTQVQQTPSETEDFGARMAAFESSIIHDAYRKYGSSRRIAKHLGISQTKANNLIRKYITPAEKGVED